MKILIARLGAFGDVIRCEGAMRDVRTAFPKAEIVFLTKRAYKEIGDKCPWVDRVILDESKGFFRTLFHASHVIRSLKREHFDLMIDLHCSWRTNFYKRFLKKTKGTKQQALPHATNLKEAFSHVLQNQNIETKHALYPNMSWLITDQDRKKMEQRTQDKGVRKPFVVLCHSCSKKGLNNRVWPHFEALATLLKEKRPELSVVTINGKHDKPLRAENVIDLGGKECPLSFSELAALLEKAHYVIGNDTGPINLASLLQKRGLGLYGEYRVKAIYTGIQLSQFDYIQGETLASISPNEVLAKIP